MKLILNTGRKLIPLFFLILFGLVCLLIFFNTDQITEKAKVALIQALEDQFGEEIEIGAVTLFPLNRVTLHDVKFGTGPEPLAQADRVVVSFYLHGFFRGVEGVVKGLKEIQLVNPQVNVIKDEDGYNFAKYLQLSIGEQKMAFTPTIRIVNGTVLYRDNRFDQRLTNLNGRIAIEESGIKLKLKTEVGEFDGVQIALDGAVTPMLALKVSVERLPLNVLKLYGLQIPQVSDLQGIVDGSVTLSTLDDGGIDYMGSVTLEQGLVELANPALTIQGIQGKVNFNRDYAVIQNLDGETEAGKFSLKGQVTSFANPGLSLSITTDGLQILPLIGLIPEDQRDEFSDIDGLVKGGAEVVGKLNNLSFKTNMTLTKFKYKDLEFENVALNGRYQNSLLTLRELKLKVDNGTFEVFSGYFDFTDLDKFNYSMTVDVKNLEVKRLLGILNLPEVPEGKLNTRLYLSGEGMDLDKVTAIGSVEVLDGKYQQIVFDRMQASFWLTAGDLGLSKVEIATPYLMTELSGNVDFDGEIDLNIEPSFINLGWFGERFNLPADGQGTIKGRLGGTIQNPNFVGEVLMNQGHLWNQNFNSMSGGIRVDKESLTLSKASVVKGDNEFEITGEIGFLREDLDLTVNIAKSSLEELKGFLDFMDIPFNLTGAIKGQIGLDGPWTSLKVRGDLTALNGVVAGQPYSSAELSFDWFHNDIVFENFKVSYGNTILQASGNLNDYKEIDIEMVGQNFDVNDIQPMRDHLPQFKGRANFRGNLTGELTSPSFWGTISTDSIKYNDIPIEQLSALLNYEDGILKIKPMKIINAGSEYTLIGEVRFLENTMELSIQNKRSQLTDILRYTGLPIKDMDYTVGGEILVKGNLTRPVFDLDVTLSDNQDGKLALQGIYDLDEGMNFEIKGTNFDLSSSKAYLNLNSFDYSLSGKATLTGKISELLADMELTLYDAKEGQIAIQGMYGLTTGMDLTLKGERLDLEQLKSLISIEGNYAGKLNITGTLEGQIAGLNADLQVDVEDGAFNNYPLKSLGGTIRMIKGETVVVNQLLALQDGNTLTVKGQIPISDPDQSLKVKADMMEGNLAILPILIPGVEKAGGKGEAHFAISGTLGKPVIEGEVNVESGFVRYTGLDLIEEMNGKILLSKDRIILNNLTAKYGDGTVLVTGRMILDGLMPDQMLLTAKVNNFHFTHGSVDAFGDGQLTIRGKLMQPEIRGKITVHDSEIKVLPVFDWPIAEEPGEFAPKFYLELFPGDNVRASGESPLSMNISILRNMDEPLIVDTTGDEVLITGELTARSGTFNFYNSNFRISRAVATFEEFNKFIPTLSISANTTIQNYRIFIDLSGLPTEAEGLSWTLTSDPPLSQDQITSLLAGQGGLGEFLDGSNDVTTMITDEIWRYINQGLRSEFLNRLEETVEKTFNLDSFYLDPVLFGDTRINVQVGKYLDDNLYVVYKRTFSQQNPEQSFGFELQLRPNISLEGVYKDEGDYQLSLKANFPF